MRPNVCVLYDAYCLRTGLGIAEDGYHPSFFVREDERFAVNSPSVIQYYGLAFFQTAFPPQPPLPQECVRLGFKSSALGVLDAPAFSRRSR